MWDSGLKDTSILNNILSELGKRKLQRFEEMASFKRVFQPSFSEIFNADYSLKASWKKEIFKNDNPIVLELGCGKGEYTVGLARSFPHYNFIGVDIKGARLWRGAKTINDEEITNAAFLRTRIEFISNCFDKNEVDEIWLTFPDPQLKNRRRKKRLCSSEFLGLYQKFLKNNGIIHLKTDSPELYHYALGLARENDLEVILNTENLYNTVSLDEILGIRTFYEQQFIQEGKNIFYLKFRLPSLKIIYEPRESDYQKDNHFP